MDVRHREQETGMVQAGSYREEFGRGWRVVLAGAIGVGFGISALPFYTLGVFVKPIGAEFGWSREEVQWGFAIQMLGVMLVGWLYGLAVDRRGARRVALLSQVGLGLSLASLALVGSLTHWYAIWFVVALLGAGTSPITWTRGIAGWFDKARGAALGIGLLGTGLTGLLAPPLVTAIVEDYGWRAGYLALGASVFVVGMPVTLWLFRDREQPAATAARPEAGGLTRGEALKSYRFWAMFVVFTLVTFGVGGLIPSLVPLLTDRGLTPAAAAGYASLAGLAVILGRVVAGFLLDRFWAPAVAVGFLVLPAISCLVLAQSGLPAPVVIGVAAALTGLAAGAEFDLVAYMVTRYFGMRHYGVVYALQLVGLSLAGGLAPPIFGRIYDTTGSYEPILLACAVIFVASPLLLLTLGRYPSFDRPQAAPAAGAVPA